MNSSQWCILDGPAIKLHDFRFDSSAWRDHLNVYVKEEALPWGTMELEQTVPPLNSKELLELLEISKRGLHLHFVPATRYYKAGFEHKTIRLPSGRSIEAATLRGCSQMWSYKSVEVLDRSSDFGDDLEKIVAERQERLDAALRAASESDVRDRILLLKRGYDELSNQKTAQARLTFRQAAGDTWRSDASLNEVD